MNSVHELGPNDDSETASSRKPSQVHKTPKLAQLGTPGTPRVHQWSYHGSLARPCRGQGRSYHGRDPTVSLPRPWPCRSAARALAPQRLRAPYRGLPMAVSWTGCPVVSRYSLASYPSASLTIFQSVLQPNSHPSQAQAITIQSLYRDTRFLPTQPASLSRYTRLYRDTPSHQAFQSRYNFVS